MVLSLWTRAGGGHPRIGQPLLMQACHAALRETRKVGVDVGCPSALQFDPPMAAATGPLDTLSMLLESRSMIRQFEVAPEGPRGECHAVHVSSPVISVARDA